MRRHENSRLRGTCMGTDCVNARSDEFGMHPTHRVIVVRIGRPLATEIRLCPTCAQDLALELMRRVERGN